MTASKSARPPQGPTPLTRPSDSSDEARAIGAAGGTAGMAGAFTWMNRDNMRRAVGAVSPATGRGAAKAFGWVVAFVAIALGGRAIAPDLGRWWTVIAIATLVVAGVVVAVARRRFAGRR